MAVAITAAWWVTGSDPLLLVVATQILQMLQQLTPLVRFDGYHVLADLTGVPDLFSRIKPTLLGVLPWRWGDPEAGLLKPWARVVITLWVALVVPLLLMALSAIVITLPRLLGTGWARLGEERGLLGDALGDGDLVQAVARVLTMVALVLPLAAVIYMLVRLGRQATTATWRSTAGKPLRRALAAVVALVLVVGLAWAWWPRSVTYRPIQPDERGTLTDLVRPLSAGTVPGALPDLTPSTSTAPAWQKGDRGQVQAVWDTDHPLPTEGEPQLAVIMQPQQTDPATAGEPPASDEPAPTPTLTKGRSPRVGSSRSSNRWLRAGRQPGLGRGHRGRDRRLRRGARARVGRGR